MKKIDRGYGKISDQLQHRGHDKNQITEQAKNDHAAQQVETRITRIDLFFRNFALPAEGMFAADPGSGKQAANEEVEKENQEQLAYQQMELPRNCHFSVEVKPSQHSRQGIHSQSFT
jgi:hypothetical protein